MQFSRSFCLLLIEFFLSIRTEISVRSLPLCQILQIFTVNFQSYFRSKYKFFKIFEGTRSLNLHLREPGVLARARAISGPGRARQETISSHLKRNSFTKCDDQCIGSCCNCNIKTFKSTTKLPKLMVEFVRLSERLYMSILHKS